MISGHLSYTIAYVLNHAVEFHETSVPHFSTLKTGCIARWTRCVQCQITRPCETGEG